MLGSVIRGPVGIFPLPPDRALAPTLPGLSGSGLFYASAFARGAIFGVRFILDSLRRLECLGSGSRGGR